MLDHPWARRATQHTPQPQGIHTPAKAKMCDVTARRDCGCLYTCETYLPWQPRDALRITCVMCREIRAVPEGSGPSLTRFLACRKSVSCKTACVRKAIVVVESVGVFLTYEGSDVEYVTVYATPILLSTLFYPNSLQSMFHTLTHIFNAPSPRTTKAPSLTPAPTRPPRPGPPQSPEMKFCRDAGHMALQPRHRAPSTPLHSQPDRHRE